MMPLNLFHSKSQGSVLVQRCNETSSLIIQESDYGNIYKPMFLKKHPKASQDQNKTKLLYNNNDLTIQKI